MTDREQDFLVFDRTRLNTFTGILGKYDSDKYIKAESYRHDRWWGEYFETAAISPINLQNSAVGVCLHGSISSSLLI